MNKPAKFGEGTVTLLRVFDAPRALVWKAWTDPKMMAQWFGPRGFTIPVCELDARVGGSLRIVMRGPDGPFSEKGGKTTLTVTSHAVGLVPIAPQMLAGMEAGWTQSIDKLESMLGDSGKMATTT
jgi:uncharacterized protein YndB with AHSA1/START domain